MIILTLRTKGKSDGKSIKGRSKAKRIWASRPWKGSEKNSRKRERSGEKTSQKRNFLRRYKGVQRLHEASDVALKVVFASKTSEGKKKGAKPEERTTSCLILRGQMRVKKGMT